jgi:hypothetical protein
MMASVAFAGGIGTIGGTKILPNVKHKILVLEFDSPELSSWGKEISQMLAQEILGTITGVTGAGVVTLRQPQERIILTADTVEGIARDNNAFVVIWGEFYREEQSVFLHSHVRIVPREDIPQSRLGLEFTLYRGGTLRASPPTFQVNFAPIELPLATLESLKSLFEQTVVLHEGPSANSRVVGELKPGDTYYPTQVQGSWIKITMTGNKSGWIRYATLGAQKEFAALRGVMLFAQGALQYISGNFKAAEKTIGTYLQKHGSSQDAMNQALAHLLLGTARWRANHWNELPRNEPVSHEYLKAAELLPNASSPVAYLMIARIAATVFLGAKERYDAMRDIEERLIHVIQTENDSAAVQNLLTFYTLAEGEGLLSSPSTSYQQYRDEIIRRKSILTEIQKNLRQ